MGISKSNRQKSDRYRNLLTQRIKDEFSTDDLREIIHEMESKSFIENQIIHWKRFLSSYGFSNFRVGYDEIFDQNAESLESILIQGNKSEIKDLYDLLKQRFYQIPMTDILEKGKIL